MTNIDSASDTYSFSPEGSPGTEEQDLQKLQLDVLSTEAEVLAPGNLEKFVRARLNWTETLEDANYGYVLARRKNKSIPTLTGTEIHTIARFLSQHTRCDKGDKLSLRWENGEPHVVIKKKGASEPLVFRNILKKEKENSGKEKEEQQSKEVFVAWRKSWKKTIEDANAKIGYKLTASEVLTLQEIVARKYKIAYGGDRLAVLFEESGMPYLKFKRNGKTISLTSKKLQEKYEILTADPYSVESLNPTSLKILYGKKEVRLYYLAAGGVNVFYPGTGLPVQKMADFTNEEDFYKKTLPHILNKAFPGRSTRLSRELSDEVYQTINLVPDGAVPGGREEEQGTEEETPQGEYRIEEHTGDHLMIWYGVKKVDLYYLSEGGVNVLYPGRNEAIIPQNTFKNKTDFYRKTLPEILNTAFSGRTAKLSREKSDEIYNLLNLRPSDGSEPEKIFRGIMQYKKATNIEFHRGEEIQIKNLNIVEHFGRGSQHGVVEEYKTGYGKMLRALRFENMARAAEKRYGLPENILLAMIMQETGGQQLLPNGVDDGGVGLCHMQPLTAHQFGLKTYENCKKLVDKGHGKKIRKIIEKHRYNPQAIVEGDYDDRFHPLKNIDTVARMLAYHYKSRPARGYSRYETMILRYTGKPNYEKYKKNVEKNRKLLADKKIRAEIERVFNADNPNLIINGKKCAPGTQFNEYINAFYKENEDVFGLEEYKKLGTVSFSR